MRFSSLSTTVTRTSGLYRAISAEVGPPRTLSMTELYENNTDYHTNIAGANTTDAANGRVGSSIGI